MSSAGLSTLVLTDDELALLRFTCDLFFVEESPLYPFESDQREPQDYEKSYHALVEKGVIDPHGFRITDAILNRIAPISECDARVVHLIHDETGAIEQTDFYLLDEIAVRYQALQHGQGEVRHIVGADMDHDELVEHLARVFVPRRASGDKIDVALSPLEFIALSLLLLPADQGAARGDPSRKLPLDGARKMLGKPPTEEALLPGAAGLIPVQKHRTGPHKPVRTDGLVGEPVWDAAVAGLVEKGVYRHDVAGECLVLRPGLADFVRGLQANRRHTFVRYDFGEDEWFMRETSFVPVDGGLFYLGPRREGGLRISELDGDALRTALYSAVGPLGGEKASDDHKKLAGFLHRR